MPAPKTWVPTTQSEEIRKLQLRISRLKLRVETCERRDEEREMAFKALEEVVSDIWKRTGWRLNDGKT